MAQRRSLSTSICTSESVESLSEWAQLLLDRLIITADDFGVHEASPAKLKAVAKPMSRRPPRDFANAVAEIATAGIVAIYESGGRFYINFLKWEMHQTGLHKRTQSRFPDAKTSASLTPADYVSRVSVPGSSRKVAEVPGTSGTVPLNEENERREENEQNVLKEESSLLTTDWQKKVGRLLALFADRTNGETVTPALAGQWLAKHDGDVDYVIELLTPYTRKKISYLVAVVNDPENTKAAKTKHRDRKKEKPIYVSQNAQLSSADVDARFQQR